jgi:hypothetical protein
MLRGAFESSLLEQSETNEKFITRYKYVMDRIRVQRTEIGQLKSFCMI